MSLEQEVTALRGEIEELKKANVLWGKKWCAAGDSLTEGAYKNAPEQNYRDENGNKKNYAWFIGKRNHMEVVNGGICGSTLAVPKPEVEGDKHPFSVDRYRNIPQDAEYITIWFGANDSFYSELGKPEDTENTTFCGALNVVLPYLIQEHPFAKIGLIASFDCDAGFRNAVKQAALRYGIPCLDWMGDPNVPLIFGRDDSLGLDPEIKEFRIRTFRVSDTNGHPGVRAHEYESTVVENFLRSL